MCVFSLATAFVGTWAWFASNGDVTATGLTITASMDDTEIDCVIYKYETATDSPIILNSSDASSLALNQYDVVFKERNKYNPVYVKIELTSSSLDASGSITLYLDRDASYDAMDEDDNLNTYSSSVTKYAVAGNSAHAGGIYDSTSVSNTWDNLQSAFLDKDVAGTLTTQSFTSGSAHNYSKVETLSFTLNYTSSDLIGDTLIVYLYINYDSSLAETYSQEHVLEIGGSSNYTLENDLTTIRIAKGTQ